MEIYLARTVAKTARECDSHASRPQPGSEDPALPKQSVSIPDMPFESREVVQFKGTASNSPTWTQGVLLSTGVSMITRIEGNRENATSPFLPLCFTGITAPARVLT